jgi:hypothetical protein
VGQHFAFEATPRRFAKRFHLFGTNDQQIRNLSISPTPAFSALTPELKSEEFHAEIYLVALTIRSKERECQDMPLAIGNSHFGVCSSAF